MTDERHEERTPRLLSEGVRARVVSLALDALESLPPEVLPAPLKKVTSFAPNRRMRLLGNQIAIALENDESFRDRVAGHVRGVEPQLTAAVESGTPPPATDPIDLAALAYLLRSEGWQTLLEDAQESAVERAAAVVERQDAQHTRLQSRLEETTARLKAAREQHRAEKSALKTENLDLRRKLGAARADLKAALADVETARSELESAARKAEAATEAADAEVRRLRARIGQLEASLTDQRRAERADRDAEGMRARLLLDTLLESVQGLRRELALPAVETVPADLVEAEIAREGVVASSGHGSLDLTDPARLDQLLALPRSHLIVDGYNVTMNAWPGMPLEQQRDRLLRGLAPLAARTSAEVTVVFDAAEKQERPLVNRPRGVRVLFSPAGVIADDVIRDLTAAEPQGRPVVVVTDDGAVARDVARSGARTARAAALTGLLTRA